MLGAAMFMVEIDGMRLLYTGDYSRAPDRHMSAADLPSPKPHIGVQTRVFACRQNYVAILCPVATCLCPATLRHAWDAFLN